MAEPTCFSFPSEFPYELDSFGSNSPADSVLSSTDDDGFFVGLPQQLSWTSLCENEKSVSPCFNPNKFEKCFRTGSPQSTLSTFDFECSKSPSMAVLGAENDARLKMNDDHLIRGFSGVQPSISVKSTNHFDFGLFSNQNCARNMTFQKVREDLVLQILCASSWRRQAPPYRKPEIHVGARCGGGTGGASHSPWLPPPLNQQPHPNSSAVRSIHPGFRRASSGTGVFLPRRHLNPSDCRDKRGIPAKRFADEIMNPNQAPPNYSQSPGFDSISSRRNNPFLSMPRNFRADEIKNFIYLRNGHTNLV